MTVASATRAAALAAVLSLAAHSAAATAVNGTVALSGPLQADVGEGAVYQRSGALCAFPFEHAGESHSACVPWADGYSWCPDSVGFWGICEEEALTPATRSLLTAQEHADTWFHRRLTDSTPEGDLIGEGQYIQRSGVRFVKPARTGEAQSCETFYFSGFNVYYPMVRGSDPALRTHVTEILDDAVELGLTVVRVWGFSAGPLEWNQMQRYPGIYNDATLVGMDFLLHQASLRGIRVLIAFENYWQHYGGTDQYNKWAYQQGEGTCDGDFNCRDRFFEERQQREYYKAHTTKLLTRTNTINGRVYKDDPSIFGWNLMNEPRSKNDLYIQTRLSDDPSIGIYNITYNNGDSLQFWIEDMADHIKAIDPVHLLTTGIEGFFGESAPLYMYANPGAWASLEGNDFVRNHLYKNIDYATMHVYVDQWLCTYEGRNLEGQMEFFMRWIEAHQQAAEEELLAPVVLEEFGGKILDGKREAIYKAAYDSCKASATRGGACAGVMFWILYHSTYEPLGDFGGGYGEFVPPSSDQMANAQAMIKDYGAHVTAVNAGNIGPGQCVFKPTWPEGLGCRNFEAQLKFGGMPWECLPGEAAPLSWCNEIGRFDLYQDPPDEWKAGVDGSELPYNTVELLIMGKLLNTGSSNIDLQDSYVTIPFSRGIHTIEEGVWERVAEPNSRFQVFCWFATMYNADGSGTNAGNVCDGAMSIAFTEVGWPENGKRDRGLRLTFSNLTICPGCYIAGNSAGDAVMISFTDQELANRLDISSLELAGASECPADPRLQSEPADPPAPPPPCSAGKHPWRACPQLEWNKPEGVTLLQPQPVLYPCDFEDCKEVSLQMGSRIDQLPKQQRASGSEEIGIIIPEYSTWYSGKTEEVRSARPPYTFNGDPAGSSTPTADQPAAMAAGMGADMGMGQAAGTRGLRQFADDEPVLPARQLLQGGADVSTWASVSGQCYTMADLGLQAGQQYFFEGECSISGAGRDGRRLQQMARSSAADQIAGAEEEEFNVEVTKDQGVASDTPNPEARGGSKREGALCYMRAEMTLAGLAGTKWENIAKILVVPDQESEVIRGVFTVPDSIQSLTICGEVELAGVGVSLTGVTAVNPVSLPIAKTDDYSPCALHPDFSPDAVYVWEAEFDDDLLVEICSIGYEQRLVAYEDGSEVASTSINNYEFNLKVTQGKRYHLVLDGQPGLPYGSTRGLSGLQARSMSCKPFWGGRFNPGMRSQECSIDLSKFVRAEGQEFYLGCDRVTYTGANTWDLMDIARFPERRTEVTERLDALQAGGLKLGRIWAYSLGVGESPEDRAKRGQITPGVYDEVVMEGLDFAIAEAAKRDIKLILALEGYWLGIEKYIEWSQDASSNNDFYTDWDARQMYKAHIYYLMNRVNTFTGVAYKDEPTIFGWNLMNEPRCTGCGWALQQFIDEFSLYIHSVNRNHMVTIGEEGFYSSTCHRVHQNPGAGLRRTGLGSSPWALAEGQDFIDNHKGEWIDFSTVHVWSDNWMGFGDYCGGTLNQNERFDYTFGCEQWREKLEFTKQWIQAHMDDSNKYIKKPLIVQEFGKTLSQGRFEDKQGALIGSETAAGDVGIRDQFFQAVYDICGADAEAGGTCQATTFWNLYREGHGDDDPYTVTLNDDSTFNVIFGMQSRMEAVADGSASQCIGGGGGAAPAAMTADTAAMPGGMPDVGMTSPAAVATPNAAG